MKPFLRMRSALRALHPKNIWSAVKARNSMIAAEQRQTAIEEHERQIPQIKTFLRTALDEGILQPTDGMRKITINKIRDSLPRVVEMELELHPRDAATAKRLKETAKQINNDSKRPFRLF